MSPYPKGDCATSDPDESLADYTAATLDEAKAFYADFYGASTGDCPRRRLRPRSGDARRPSSSAAGRARALRARSAAVPEVAADNQPLETPDKANAFFIAGLNLKLRDDDPDYPGARARQLHARRRLPELAPRRPDPAEGGPLLRRRVAVRGRRSTSPGPSRPSRSTRPQNAAKLEAAFKEEIARALKDGFEEKEIARRSRAGCSRAGHARAGRLARPRLATDLFLDRTLAWDADFEKKIEALTPDEIVAAMRGTSTPKITIVKAGDFAKAKP